MLEDVQAKTTGAAKENVAQLFRDRVVAQKSKVSKLPLHINLECVISGIADLRTLVIHGEKLRIRP